MSSLFTFGLANPLGVSSSDSSSIPSGTFDAFSSPISISTLIVPPGSLCVNLFHLPHRPRQVRARLVEAEQRRNLVVVRTCERILCLNHFDVVRHSRFETVPPLVHFFLRKLHAQIRHLHFISRRLHFQHLRSPVHP